LNFWSGKAPQDECSRGAQLRSEHDSGGRFDEKFSAKLSQSYLLSSSPRITIIAHIPQTSLFYACDSRDEASWRWFLPSAERPFGGSLELPLARIIHPGIVEGACLLQRIAGYVFSI
jgi:hypothetical protein